MKSQLYLLSILIIALLSILVSCAEPAGRTAEEERNIAVLHHFYEQGVNKGDVSIWDSLLTDDYVRHCEAMPPELKTIRGKEQMIEFLSNTFGAFPDWNEEIELLVAEGDMIAYTTNGTGTFENDFGGMEANGEKAQVTNFIFQRFEDGKIAETWITWDNIHFLSTVGKWPPPAPAMDTLGADGRAVGSRQ